MTNVVVCCLLSVTLWALPAGAGPRIISMEPAKLRVEPVSRSSTRVTLTGRAVTRSDTTGYNLDQHVQVWVRGHSRVGFERLRIVGWTVSSLAVQVDHEKWMRKPNLLEFKVVVAGFGESPTRSLYVEGLQGPPRLKLLQTTQVPVLPTGQYRNDRRRMVRAVADNLTSDTEVFVGSTRANIALMPPASSVVDFWIPEALQASAGTYQVSLRGPLGASASLPLRVGQPGVAHVVINGPVEQNSNRAGMDFRRVVLSLRPSANQCLNACRNTPRCRSYTFVKPTSQDPRGYCWLKHGVPTRTGTACCTSGVVR